MARRPRRCGPDFSEGSNGPGPRLVFSTRRLRQVFAAEKGVTTAQLALAWVLRQGDYVVPIPGARKLRHLEDNVGTSGVRLSRTDLDAIERASPPEAVSGSRYMPEALRWWPADDGPCYAS